MTIAEIRARLEAISEEMEGIIGAEGDFDQERFTALETESEGLKVQIARAKSVQVVRETADSTEGIIERATPKPADLDRDPMRDEGDISDKRSDAKVWDIATVRTAGMTELQERARDAAEKASGMSDNQRAALTGWIDNVDVDDEDAFEGTQRFLRHVVVTSSPDYLRAWRKAFLSAARSGTPDPQAVGYLSRAMSLTDSAGGFAVPQQLDPTLILTSDGTTNPVREIARKVLATGDVWEGLSTTHASWSWDGEAGEVSDDTTTFAHPTITVRKAQGFIPFSIEINQDYPNFTSDVQRILALGKDDLEAAAFIIGASGSGAPIGIVTALTGGSSVVASATTDTFAVGDLYAVEEALPAKYRSRAKWMADKPIYNDVRQFGTADSHALWERLGAGQPAQLLGYPTYEASEMDGSITATEDNLVLILGDWENYVIADRVGFSLELVPHLFATANNRPNGQRGFFAYYRVGADSVNDGAFRVLNVT